MPRSTASHALRAQARFRRSLGAEGVEAIARESRFVQRRRVVTGSSVFWALVVTVGAHCTQYISDVLRTLNAREGWSIRYKPFWDRLAKAAFPRFMKSMFGRLCRDLVSEVLRAEEGSDASFFSDVFIDDGSSFAVADGLSRVFPGRFTKVTPAAVELHARMSLKSDQLVSVTLAPDKEAERQFLPAAESLPARSLSLRDRGYVDLEYFAALEARSNGPAYLVCRTTDKINPVVDDIRGVPHKLARKWQGKKLQELPRSLLRQGADLLVSWPWSDGQRLQLRLVVRFRQPRQSKERRKKRLTAKERRYEAKNQWAFLLTNLPAQFSADAIVRLYRLRWQVELAFKEWKSYANLHALQSEHPSIVEGFIWASLCAALIKRALAHCAQLTYGTAISVRIAAQSGPQLLPRLADWITRACTDAFATLLAFLAKNARRAHPDRDERRAQATLGFAWATQPVGG
jgi:hypothetical protein